MFAETVNPTALFAEAAEPPVYMPIEEAGGPSRPQCSSTEPCEVPQIAPLITDAKIDEIHQWARESKTECGDPLVEDRYGRGWCYLRWEFGSTSGASPLSVFVKYQVFTDKWAITELKVEQSGAFYSDIKKLEAGEEPDEGYVVCGGCQAKRDRSALLYDYDLISQTFFKNRGSKGHFIRAPSHADLRVVVQPERIVQLSDGQGGYSCERIPAGIRWQRLMYETPRDTIEDYLRKLVLPWNEDTSFSTAFDPHEFHFPTIEWRRVYDISDPSTEVDACGYVKSVERSRRQGKRSRYPRWDRESPNTSPVYPLPEFHDWSEDFQFSFADPNSPPLNFIDRIGTQPWTGSYIGLVRLVE